jgi:hypothetical protein
MYFRMGSDLRSFSNNNDLPLGQKEVMTLGLFPTTAIEVLSYDNEGRSSSGSFDSITNPELLSIIEDDPLGAEIHGEEL